MKKIVSLLLAALVVSLGTLTAAAKSKAPDSVIHVVTVSWKKDATPEQIQAALDATHRIGDKFPGITRVWTKTIKAQGERTHAIVMEFKDEQALKDYPNSEGQKEWYKVYIPIRERSTTFDITN